MVRGRREVGRDRFLLGEGQRESRLGLGWRPLASLRRVFFLRLLLLLLFRRFEGQQTVETDLVRHLLVLFIYADLIPLVLDPHWSIVTLQDFAILTNLKDLMDPASAHNESFTENWDTRGCRRWGESGVYPCDIVVTFTLILYNFETGTIDAVRCSNGSNRIENEGGGLGCIGVVVQVLLGS